MKFDEIVGQNNVIRFMKNSLANKRIAHAYIFCGPEGVGKSLIARIFASALNCRENGIEPCGICSSCIKAGNENHPDIILFKTLKSSISVEDIRELQTEMYKKPYEGKFKVYIIHEALKMTEQAQNALLKTLEEPLSHVVIILLAENQYGFLNTIVSRCQVIKFTRVTQKEIYYHLIKKYNIKEEEALYISALSGGILGKALDLLHDDSLRKQRDEIIILLNSVYNKDKYNALMQADYFIENKDKIDYIIEIMISWFRDILIYKECGNTQLLINKDKEQMIINDSERFTYRSLEEIMDKIKQTADNIRSNVNYQLSIETMLLRIQEG